MASNPANLCQSKTRIIGRGAETVFRSHFGASLGDLRVLYENPNWKGAGDYGGNHWAGITRAVIAWSDAIDTDNASTSERI